MNQYYWDTQIDYLIRSRRIFHNDDYIEFLITKVWKFTKPIHIVDFGCGVGFIGLKFLPLLPPGSKYTGIDKGEDLLQKARETFSALPYEAEFILSDIDDVVLEEGKYDAAICHAVLMHVTNPRNILSKMVRCTRSGGKVICFEAHRNAADVNWHIGGLGLDQICNPTILQKLRELDRERIGKDGNIGIKLPIYMRELGLRDIDCRISDRTNYIHPDLPNDEQTELLNLFESEGYCAKPSDDEVFIAGLVGRGLTEEEAREELRIEKFVGVWMSENGMHADCVFAGSMMISYGDKP